MKINRSFIYVLLFFSAIAIVAIYGKVKKYGDVQMPDTKEMEDIVRNAEWKNGALFGDDVLYYENDGLCYKNIKNGKGRKLCTKAGCVHNNDECMARFDPDVIIEQMYVLDHKLYLVGYSQDSVVLYRCDVDGNNHETVSRNSVAAKSYSDIFWMSCLKKDQVVYIGVTVQDSSETKVLKDGSMSDAPGIARFFSLDLKSGRMKELYSFKKSYQCFLNLQYVDQDKLFFEYQGNKLPYEKIIKNENNDGGGGETDLSAVYALDLQKNSLKMLKGRKLDDLVGFDGQDCYINIFDNSQKMTGIIQKINCKTNRQTRVYADDIKGTEIGSGKVYLLQNGFAVNLQKENDEMGQVIILNKKGKKIKRINSAKWFIVGEYKGVYLLSRNAVVDRVSAYISKKDIEKMNMKVVELNGEE